MRALRITTTAAVIWVCLLVTAGPAAAHAELRASDPARGERLEQAPQLLRLDFTEGVTLTRGGMRLLDGDGEAWPLGTPRISGATVTVPIRGLGEGAYVLAWRVVSADSHPVHGAVPFVVGDAALPVATELGGGGDAAAAAVLAVLRWVGYAGTALLVGSAALVIGCWPGGRGRHGTRRSLLAGGSLTVGAALGGLLAQGPYAEGRPLSDVFAPDLLAATLELPFGRAGLTRVVAGAALTGWALYALCRPGRETRGDPPAAQLLVGAGLAGLVAVTYSAQGHAWAASPRMLAVAVDGAHVLAMSVWLGGLVVLTAVALGPCAPTHAQSPASAAARPLPAGGAIRRRAATAAHPPSMRPPTSTPAST